MDNFKIVVFIMAILISLTAIANRRKLPIPILLLATGLVIGFIPQLPDLVLDPDVVFLLILPPLLYDAASKTSWHEFRASIRPISALAITLVFFTTIAVAVTAYFFIPGFTWPLAFLLGAVISPPDAVAVSGIIKGLGLNRKVITILEGESLVNDAAALVAYRYAITAVISGTFVFWEAGLRFLWIAGAGIITGIIIGFLFVLAHRNIKNNPVVETSLTLLAPFISYLAAEQFHLSGVLAVVSTGLFISWRAPEIFTYQERMRIRVVWDTLIFLLHGFVFILIGLQLPSIIKDLGSASFTQYLAYGLLVSVVTMAVRIGWVFAGAYWMNFSQQRKNRRNNDIPETPDGTWKNVLVVAWTGTRGVISLAAALAIPLVLTGDTAFPQRHAIIFLTFVVIFVTLVVQGLTLPLLIRLLKIKPIPTMDPEEKELKLLLATSTHDFIENELDLSHDHKVQELLIKKYEKMIRDLTKDIRRQEIAKAKDLPIPEKPPDALLDAQLAITTFQRSLLLRLHKEGEFSDAAIRQVEREMDINELKLNLQVPGE